MESPELTAAAKAIADGLATPNNTAQDLGIDPFTILTIVQTLLPILISCFKKSADTANQTPAYFLANHYDEQTQTFDQWLVDRARGQTRRAAAQHGNRRLGRDKLDAITVASFQHAMNAPASTVAACMFAAPTIADV